MIPIVVGATGGLIVHAEILDYQGRYFPIARPRALHSACITKARLAMLRKYECYGLNDIHMSVCDFAMIGLWRGG